MEKKLAEQGAEKEVPAQDGKKLSEELGRFFAGYGGPDGIQGSESASIDPQIKNLSLPVATKIAATQQGTVLDIGCGKGVILRRLAEIDSFRQKPGWIYVGADFEENTQEILGLAVGLKLHRRVDAVELKDLYASWVAPEIAPRPLLVVIRNVFHELSIDDTATLVTILGEQLTADDLLVIQDLQVFPVAERKNACWNPQFFTKMLERCGFQCASVEEPSPRGNRWFTVHATRTGANKWPLETVRCYVIEERKRQYDFWNKLGALAHDDARLRPPELALLDFDLQCFALGQQLLAVQSPGVAPPTPEAENAIAFATFQKHLTEYDRNNLVVAVMRMERSPHFRDRANSQDALEEYLRGAQQVVVIQGGSFMGKSVLVREVLSRRAHDRCSVMLDIRQTSSVWNLVEQYLAEIGCAFPTDLLAGFPGLRFAGVSAAIARLVEDIAASTVVVIDHFEQLLDPNNSVGDEEIRQFLEILASPAAAKLIITSRRLPDLGFFPGGVGINAVQPPVGRFPEGKHVENVLDDFIDRARLSITSYPASLLDAIDRYPYMAVLTARIIQREGPAALSDEALLESIRSRLREDLLRRIVTPLALPAIELLAFLRVPIPRVMFESLADKDSVRAAEELGLLYTERDRYFDTVLTGATILRGQLVDGDEPPEIPADPSEASAVSRRHTQISHWYARLYRQSDDPRWLRELHFHTLAAGDESLIGQFGATYKAELFAAGNHWFRVRRNYRAALVAFLAAKKFGLDNYDSNIRIASCLMRVGRRDEAEVEYARLIAIYPRARGLKTSYIDSLLNVRDFTQALAQLNEYGFKASDDPWIAHEFGRSYLGLHQYQHAVQAFETEIRMEPKPVSFILLAQAYFRSGDLAEADRVLSAAMRRFEYNRGIRLAYATNLIRLGALDGLTTALPLLVELHGQHPSDGGALHQLIKLLCLLQRADDARRLYARDGVNSTPERFKIPMQVEIDIADHKWDVALSRLSAVAETDEHLIGLKKKVHLRQAGSAADFDDQRAAARAGLAVPIHQNMRHNMPILITSYKLARLADDVKAASEFAAAINQINPSLATRLSGDALPDQNWDE